MGINISNLSDFNHPPNMSAPLYLAFMPQPLLLQMAVCRKRNRSIPELRCSNNWAGEAIFVVLSLLVHSQKARWATFTLTANGFSDMHLELPVVYFNVPYFVCCSIKH